MPVTTDLIAAVREHSPQHVRDILREHPDAVAERDDDGATALHYAAESGQLELVDLLLDAGADINARDRRFHGTPTGWSIEYLRLRGGLLATEIDDAKLAIDRGDMHLLQQYLHRLPALQTAATADGTPLAVYASQSGHEALALLFGVSEAG